MRKKLVILVAFAVLLLGGQGALAAHASSSDLKDEIKTVIGTTYKYGGTTTSGFDCSGFIRYIFDKFEVDLPRTSSSQAETGDKVAKSDLRAGDLVFFNTNGKGVSHAGVYIGDGKFAHASTSRGVTYDELDSNYYKKRYVTARRVLTNEQFESIVAAN